LSSFTAVRLARELNLQSKQIETILESIKSQSRKRNLRTDKDSRRNRILELEVFRLLADWYHFPLLELMRTKGFRSDPHWIARRLGLQVSVVEGALERLESLGFIRRKRGEMSLTEGGVLKTSDDIQSLAIRKHHEQMLRKATEALTKQDTSQREFQALNLNFDVKSVPEAKKFIRKFMNDFNHKFARSHGEQIYQINLQLFSLTGG
jgi:uncharacterized protein (TIGR02147 family)